MTPPPAPASGIKWSGQTRGGYWGNLFFAVVLRLFGLRATFVPLVPIAAYYLLASRASVRSAGEYFERLFGPLPPALRLWYVYKNFYSLGQMLMERLAIIRDAAGRFPCMQDGMEHLRDAAALGRGVIVLGAHVGNWEAAGHLLRAYNLPVNMVGFDREERHIRRLFDAQMRERAFRFIAADAEGPAAAIAVLAALRRGELVALHGDRVFGGASAEVPFLGRPARFPLGAYQLAAISGAPLVMAFGARERVGCYRLVAFPRLDPPTDASRAARAAFTDAAVRLYVQRLEALVRRYPFQWYNFFPFWD
jgi:predicted LPLAT superfamily acyltransferase